MILPGSYDDAFAGAAAVIHAGATAGFNRSSQKSMTAASKRMHVIESVKRSGSVGLVFTSSFAAVEHLVTRLIFTEKIIVVTILKPTRPMG